MTIDAMTPPAEMKLRQLRSRSQVVGMTTRAVKMANSICESRVKLPMVRCAFGNNFDKLSLSKIKYSMQHAYSSIYRIIEMMIRPAVPKAACPMSG